MELNTKNLKIELNNLNEFIEEYETNYLNLYNEISNIPLYWKDNKSIAIVKDISLYKQKIKILIDEIYHLQDVYVEILESYSTFGEKIYFDLKNEDNLITNYDSYISELEKIINSYKNLDLNFCLEESQQIINEKNLLLKNKETIQQIKENTLEVINNIEEIEKEIKLKISRLTIEIIKEQDLNSYNRITENNAIMDTDQMSILLNKIQMYKKEEDIIIESINKTITNLIYNYKTSNTEGINKIQTEIINKLKIITKIHNNYITFINQNIENYKETERKVLNILENQ